MLKELGKVISKVIEGVASLYFSLCFFIVIAIFPIKAIGMLVSWLWNMF